MPCRWICRRALPLRISLYASVRGSVTLKIVPCSAELTKETLPFR
jgi:hypothetical protein